MPSENDPYPRILARQITRLSPWAEGVEKQVLFAPGDPPQTYHCMTQAAYVGMLVRTAAGLFPIVRQYHPAVETYTWEFPAGTLEPGETPEQAARRTDHRIGIDPLLCRPPGAETHDYFRSIPALRAPGPLCRRGRPGHLAGLTAAP
jgi:hypothetical protein